MNDDLLRIARDGVPAYRLSRVLSGLPVTTPNLRERWLFAFGWLRRHASDAAEGFFVRIRAGRGGLDTADTRLPAGPKRAWADFLARHGVSRCFRVDYDADGGWVQCYTDPPRLAYRFDRKSWRAIESSARVERLPPRWVNWDSPPPVAVVERPA